MNRTALMATSVLAFSTVAGAVQADALSPIATVWCATPSFHNANLSDGVQQATRAAMDGSDEPVKILDAMLAYSDNEALGAAIIREFDAVCPDTARAVLGDDIIDRAILFNNN